MKRHQRDPIATHVTFGQKQLNRPFGLRQPIQGRRTGSVYDKNRRRRGALYPPNDPKIIGSHLNPSQTSRSATQTLPRNRGAQCRDQIEAGAPSRIPSNRSIGAPSTRVGPHRPNPPRTLLRGGTAAHFPRICELGQETRRQGGAHRLKYHFSQ
jgi:hypothetical protein